MASTSAEDLMRWLAYRLAADLSALTQLFTSPAWAQAFDQTAY
jgi:hypothetical protein